MAEKSESSKPKEGPRKCEACAITLPDIYAYTDHLESKEHYKGLMKKKYGKKYLEAKANLVGQKLDKTTESDESESSDDEDNVYTCEVCQKICTGSLNYKLHLAGKSHEKKVKKAKLLKQMKKDKLIPENDNSTEGNALVNGLFSTSQFSSSEILCKVCNKKCTGPEAFKQHNKSESHKKKLAMQSLMKDIGQHKHSSGNNENDDSNEETERCDICCKEFSGPLPYQQHMESTAHLKQVKLSGQLVKFKDLIVSSDDNNQIQCKECNKWFSGLKPFKDHLKSSTHSKLKQKKDLLSTLKEKYPEMLVQSLVVEDSEESEGEELAIICTVCHTTFTGPESARDHFQSQKHKKAIKEKMRYEKYKQLKNSKKSNTKSKSEVDDDEEENDSSDGFDIIN